VAAVEQAACAGGAPYAVLDDLTISVSGRVPTWDIGSAQEKKLLDMWEKWGDAVKPACREARVPVTWFMGIMAVESQGNPRACSPCTPDLCAFYPRCQPCCAYGLMQFINSTARCYGATGAELLGDGPLAIKVAAKHLAASIYGNVGTSCAPGPYGLDLPRIASGYNCGGARCKGTGTLGLCGQHDYPMMVVRYANTAERLGIPTWAGALSLAAIGGGVLAVGGLTAAYLIYSGRMDQLKHKFGI